MITDNRINEIETLMKLGNSIIKKDEALSDSVWKKMAAGESAARSKEFVSHMQNANVEAAKVLNGKSLSANAEKMLAVFQAAAKNPMEFISNPVTNSGDSRFADALTADMLGSQSLNMDYGKTPFLATEYFSDKDLDKNLGLSWALNVRALEIQSEFAETLYGTIAVENNDVGITIRTKVTTVSRGVLNALLKENSVVDHRRPLHEALTDHTVLQDDAIRIVPYVVESGQNSQYFVSSDIIDNEYVQLGRVPSYPTNFLSTEQTDFNLLQLAAHPGIVQEGYDETDEIAPGVALGTLLISIRKKGEKVEDGSVIKLQTRDQQFAQFNRPQDGDGRQLLLNFRETRYALNGKSLDKDDAEIPALALVKTNDYTLYYRINMNASLSVGGPDVGKLEITGLNVKIVDIRDAEGSSLDLTKGTAKSIIDNTVISVAGFKIDATRTNENRRTQGLLLDPIWEQENYKLQYGSPIMTKSPVGVEYNDAERLDDILSAIYIRNESLAVTQTLSYTEQIKQAVATKVTCVDKVAIRGLGRHWVHAWYEESDFDVSELIQSLETKDCLINARQGLLQRLGDQVTRAVQDSAYIPAMRMLMADPKALPEVIIATDEPTAAMLLLQYSDSRLVGDRYTFKTITTNDDRWRILDKATNSYTRRLQWFLRVPGSDSSTYNVLNWGNHFWSPVFVTNMNIQRTGSTAKELAAQPRNAHINHCPITGVLWIKGITELVAKRLAYFVKTAAVDNTDGNVGSTDGSTNVGGGTVPPATGGQTPGKP